VPNYSPRRAGNRARPGPATAAFVIVVTAVGAVTRAFGVDAGLIALVLATIALVLGPYVYSGIDQHADRPEDSDDPGTGVDDRGDS
jgi:hypothetical protein